MTMNFSESLALKAVSLLLASILWITIIGFKREEVVKSIEFEPELAPGLVIVKEIPRHIQYTFSGPRLGLKRLGEMLPNILRPDWKHLGPSSLHEVILGEELIGKLRDGVKVVSIYPAKFYVRLEELIERPVKVNIITKGKPADGFSLRGVRAIPSRIVVSGPKSIVESLTSVDTEAFDVEGLEGLKEGDVNVDLNTAQGLLSVVGGSTVKVRVTTVRN